MARVQRFVIYAAIVALAAGASLRKGPAHRNSAQVAAVESDATKVANLRAKLQQVQKGLSNLFAKEGPASSGVATLMSKFNSELNQTLKETQNSSSKEALQKLKNAESGVHALVKDLTKQQVQLMHENGEQETSLLLGVLMTRQNEPMKEQLEVLNKPEFHKLPVVKAVLKANNTKTPLFQQVAAELDKLNGNHTVQAKASKSQRVNTIVQSLERRLHQLETAEERRQKVHSTEMKELDKRANLKGKNNTHAAHHALVLKRVLHRKFQKESALAKKDIRSMRSAINAIKTGDMAALRRAQLALKESLKSMESHGGGFLYLIQIVHRSEGLDCPFCAAQCVEKCHNEGKSYTTCLTDCADAGK